jgi:hypothetical protein
MHKTPNCLSTFMFPNSAIDHEVACIRLPITCQQSCFLVSPSITKLHVIQNSQSPTKTHMIACQHLCHHLSLQVPTPFDDIHLELLISLANCHHMCKLCSQVVIFIPRFVKENSGPICYVVLVLISI